MGDSQEKVTCVEQGGTSALHRLRTAVSGDRNVNAGLAVFTEILIEFLSWFRCFRRTLG